VSLPEDFWELFEGRTDIFGNATNPAAPFRGQTDVGPQVWNRPTDIVAAHLSGATPIGVYPMMTSLMWVQVGGPLIYKVRWGCIDFDDGYEQSWPDAVNVKAVLAEFGISAWIEKTREKGWHVWVFASEWVPARTMRRALLAACQIVGAPTKEINPKQETLEEGKVGNFVRLPYPGGDKLDGKQAVHDFDGWYTPERFVRRALDTRCTAKELEPLADLYVEPKPVFVPRPLGPLRSDLCHFPPLVQSILEGEPFERKRSDQMARIAHIMHDEGYPAIAARAAVDEADNRWGKYVGRRDRDEILDRIVGKVYAG
jgi:hypothetical protein